MDSKDGTYGRESYQGPFSGRYYCGQCGDAASSDPCSKCRTKELKQEVERLRGALGEIVGLEPGLWQTAQSIAEEVLYNASQKSI